MLRNYLKIALRHILKNKGFSLLNIAGLAIGLTCSLLILLWIQDELSYNKFHKRYGELFQVMENQSYEGKTYTFMATPGMLASAMLSDLPEVQNTTRLGWDERWLFSLKNKPIYENGHYTDASFFKMFSFDILYGDPKNPLPDENSIVITEKMMKKFFGDEDPVGKFIKANDKKELRITAVVKDPPLNSTIQFSWLAHFKLFEEENPWWDDWQSNGLQTYVQLKAESSLDDFNLKFRDYIKGKDAQANARPFLLPMKDWRLRSTFEEGKQVGGRIQYVKLFGFIAILLIIIACINFMNLATARSEQRAREVGVRKVMGALRSGLILQFIGESIVMAVFSMVIACLLVLLFLPSFNELVGKQLSFINTPHTFWVLIPVAVILCGILAGSYPALFLSSFKPVTIFKGLRHNVGSSAAYIRKGLVITQFVISIVMIISTIVIYKQIQHAKNRELGYNRDKLLYLSQKGMINEKLDVITQDLLNTGMVTHAASCNQRLIQMGSNSGGFKWEGKDASNDVLITTEYVSPDYLKTVGIKLAEGRDFSQDANKDSNNIIINETLAKIMGAKDPISKIIRMDSSSYTIVGVVKDFIYNDMYKKPDPVMIFCRPRYTSYYFIRLKQSVDMEQAISAVEGVFKKDNPGYPFEYNFIDADFDLNFKSEMLISKLSRLFAVITILISCLGLFGLAAYTAERRTKEIGIRKVLGATVQNVVSLLSKDFLKLVLFAIVIGTPLAWYIMHQWLQDYSYRIDIQVWMLFIAGLAALLIAFITVSFQAIRAAITNPVKSLRTE